MSHSVVFAAGKIRAVQWMGPVGYLLAYFHVDAAMNLASGSCLITLGLLIWPFSIVWALPAFWMLVFHPYERAFFWHRVGLAVGFATYVFPFALLNIGPMLSR